MYKVKQIIVSLEKWFDWFKKERKNFHKENELT